MKTDKGSVPVSSTGERSASPAEPRVYMLGSDVEPFRYVEALRRYLRRKYRQGAGNSAPKPTAGVKL